MAVAAVSDRPGVWTLCRFERVPPHRHARLLIAHCSLLIAHCYCRTSSAPNYDEACDAESRRDFAHKLGIAAKEMRETSGWLRFLIKVRLVPTAMSNEQ
ncbi:MAG TPA: four helix bundle protein [Verrucomicrobiae bacterium]|nr:four helix bundle protein [Verrucomicrobiae bacterium]